ncbi:MAG: acetate kinase [Pseudolysinimonas sp.]|uniref:acetate/propionate family kinase n=1 Tax=Pseudolysinimonas sp. TaxID=2680009 RepID=UPI003264337F
MTAPRVLVVNAGSSSLKYRVVDPSVPGRGRSALQRSVLQHSGLIERIGEPGSEVPDHQAALATALADVDLDGVVAVGHRVVHGGEFDSAVLIDAEVERRIDELSALAPLHNPPALAGIRAARAALPELPQVAVFDTAFHATMPREASTYAIDAALAAEHGIRRYGFHGTSYRYVSARAAEFLGRPLTELRLIVLHLGNGASAAAILNGRSIDTSMGLTPLEGLVMGTRSGDIDPGVLFHLHAVTGADFDELDDLLNRRSGLLGLAGRSDMREVQAAADAGSDAAALALDVYLHRLRRYIGAYLAELGGLDALVFTAGVGENSAIIRARAVERLAHLGLAVDPALNAAAGGDARVISPPGATPVLVVPTDEESQIAMETIELVAG